METKTKTQAKISDPQAFLKPPSLRESRQVTLAEALDRVLDKGAVLQGDLTLRLAEGKLNVY